MKLKKLLTKQSKPIRCQWQGVTSDGWKDSGIINVTNKKEALIVLQQKNITPLTLKFSRLSAYKQQHKIKLKDIADFTRQLASLLQTGLHLLPALTIISQNAASLPFKHIINKIIIDINKGKPLSDALKPFKKYFNDLYRGMIYAAEQTGSYANTLADLADYLVKSIALKNKIKKALLYPLTVLIITIIITIGLLLFVVPQFQTVFSSFNAELPFFTQTVINLANTLQSNWWLCLIIPGGISLSYKILARFDRARFIIAHILFKLPKLGSLIKTGLICRWASLLATLLASGVDLSQALDITAKAITHPILQKHTITLQKKLCRGQSIAAAMQDTAFFDSRMLAMIKVGETSGKLSELLHKITSLYQTELDYSLNNLSKMIEPVIMMILAIVAGGLIIAMYLPILQIGSVL